MSPDGQNKAAISREYATQCSDDTVDQAKQVTLARIHPVCERFEDAWQEGKRPEIANYLAEVAEADRAVLFEELLQLDIHYRERSGEKPKSDDYDSTFPQYRDTIARCFSAPRESQDQLPAMIGKYRVIARLGSGGQAEVFRVGHPQLERELVIKRQRTVMTGADRDRMLQEGKVLAELKHPNLIHIYDVDFDDGHPYLVMEYVSGRSLKEYAEHQQIKPPEAATIVAKVARALQEAHQHGVAHLDVKPENIVIDKQGEPRLIDFGMAKRSDAWQREQPEGIGGTVAYMAPEQASEFISLKRTDDSSLGPRCDQYSLGAVLYWLLTGRPPIRPDRDEEITDVLERVAKGHFDRQLLDNSRPQSLAKVCRRAMQTDPAKRFVTTEEFAAALDKITRRSTTRRNWLVATGLAAVVVCATLILWPKVDSDQSRPPSAPTIEVTNSDGVPVKEITAGKPVLFSGTAEPGAQIRLTFGTETRTVDAGGDGKWSLQWTPPRKLIGEQKLIADAKNATGNVSQPTSPFKLTVTTPIPTRPTLDPLTNTEFATGRRVNFSGSADPGSQVRLTLGRLTLDPVAADHNGQWSLSLTPDESLVGVHRLSAVAADTYGNASPTSKYVEIEVVDRTPPPRPTVDAITDPDGKAITELASGRRVSFSGSTEPGSQVQVTLGKLTLKPVVVDQNGRWSVETILNESMVGSHKLEAVAVDAHDNMSSPSQDLEIDVVDRTPPPRPTIEAIADGDVLVEATVGSPVQLSVTARAASKVRLELGDDLIWLKPSKENGKWTHAWTPGYASFGTTKAVAVAVDAAGNESEASRSFQLSTNLPQRLELNLGTPEKPIPMKFELIPAGKFMMGRKGGAEELEALFKLFPYERDDEWNVFKMEINPAREEKISEPFYMSIHEVTRQQFEAFAGPSDHRTYKTDREKSSDVPPPWPVSEWGKNWRIPGAEIPLPNHPVTWITLNDARDFCDWLERRERKLASGRNVRVPTEKEWEYACRYRPPEQTPAGSRRTNQNSSLRYSHTDDPRELKGYANLPNRQRVAKLTIEVVGPPNHRPGLQASLFPAKLSLILPANVDQVEFRDQVLPNEVEQLENAGWGFQWTPFATPLYALIKTSSDDSNHEITVYNDSSVNLRLHELRDAPRPIPVNRKERREVRPDRPYAPRGLVVRIKVPGHRWKNKIIEAGSELMVREDNGEIVPIYSFWQRPEFAESGKVSIINALQEAIDVQELAAEGKTVKVLPSNQADPAIVQGVDEGVSNQVDWSDGCPNLAVVGRFRPNEAGLYDMHGNVWEWCDSQYEDDKPLNPEEEKKREKEDPKEPRYILKGGCYL